MIASGHAPGVVLRATRREHVGTFIPAIETSLEQRKKRILAGSQSAGRITVDEGAAHAVRGGGSSLLPAGVTSVDGKFARGDTIIILSPSGEEVARGLARYGSDEMQKIAGVQSVDIESRLGYAYGPVAVHRNDMIVA